MEKIKNYLNEVKAISVKVGDTFKMSDELGEFKRGEEVTVIDVEPSGEDIVVTLRNESGKTDTFYFDKSDII